MPHVYTKFFICYSIFGNFLNMDWHNSSLFNLFHCLLPIVRMRLENRQLMAFLPHAKGRLAPGMGQEGQFLTVLFFICIFFKNVSYFKCLHSFVASLITNAFTMIPAKFELTRRQNAHSCLGVGVLPRVTLRKKDCTVLKTIQT